MRFLTIAVLWTLTGVSCMHKSSNTEYPHPAKKPHKMEKHGDVRVDDYFWMKDRESKEVISHLNAENKYWEAKLAPVKDLRETLYKEMRAKIKEDDTSAPARKDEFYYYVRTETGKQYPIFARRKGLQAPEEVLADVNKISQGHDFTQCTGPMMSPNQNLMALGCDFKGRRFYDFTVKDLTTGKDMGVELKDVTSNMVWAADNETFFYVKQHPETLRSQWVYRYNIKTKKSDLVYEEKDETFSVGLSRSLARKHIFIGSYSTLTTEIRYVAADRPTDEFKVFLPREREHRYDVMDGEGKFYIVTNWKAKNNRLMETPFGKTDKKNWKDVIAHRNNVYLDDVTAFKHHLVIKEREAGQDRLVVKEIGKKITKEIQMRDQSFVVDLAGNMEYDPSFVRYEYESMRQPETTFDYDFNTGVSRIVKVREVPGFDPDKYRTERVWIVARDGQRVPVSLLMKKEIVELDSKTPMLVYGYGSYGMSMAPWFSANRMSLVDRGWVYAMAHIRGGRELGEDWYNNGRTMKKMNTFTDFVDVTDSLIKLGYADPKRVYAQGGSAGGLLMGAVINLRPELYKGVVAQVPFVDVMTTMLDDSIPLTTGEYDEWGNPNEKPAYDYMRSYSPYDNLKKGPYPNLLATTGLHDSQVQYWEPAKWVAKIRDLKTNDSMILLKTDMSSGHGGASGRFEALKEIAVEYAFLLMLDGTTK